MKNIILILSAILLSNQNYAQIIFEKGYFIDELDNKIDCLIKNVDWKNNPISFNYKLTESSPTKTASIDSVKEFEISGSSKYVRATVKMDISINASNMFSSMSSSRAPEFEEVTIFLKSEVEGKAKLYSYKKKNMEKYFFQIENSEIEFLIYKLFKINKSAFGKNEAYKAQLQNQLKCESITQKDIESLYYAKKGLTNFFRKYNLCVNPSIEDNSQNTQLANSKAKNIFNVTIRPGLSTASLSIETLANSNLDVKFDREITFRLGIEAELILPFNKNKWSLLFEPTFHNYQSETQIPIVGRAIPASRQVIVDYQSIEVPLGVRYYLFLNQNSKFFFNTAYIFDFTMNGEVNYQESANLDISSNGNLTIGAGYKFKNRGSLEVRNGLNRDILKTNGVFSDYNNLSIILGFTIL